ncbi:hypothetical protein JCM10213v2_007035 [Rhodosporidiobolus nylandii]
MATSAPAYHPTKQAPASDGATLEAGPSRTSGEPPMVTVQPLRRADMQPSYAQDVDTQEAADLGCYGSMMNCLGAIFGTLGSIPGCFCCPNPFKEVNQGSVGLVTRFGRFSRAVDPGLVKINPLSEKLSRVDVKIQTAEIPRQTVLTKDNLQVDIESVLIYHINNPYRAAFGINNLRAALIERSQTTLRDLVGGRNLQSILTEREALAAEIEQVVEATAEQWGVSISAILIKDIVIPPEIQSSLSSAAQQRRLAEAKIIAAQAEVDSARLMREAADILSSPAAIQIRQLESLQAMARTANSKADLPLLLDQQMGGGPAGSADSGLINNTAMMQALNEQ